MIYLLVEAGLLVDRLLTALEFILLRERLEEDLPEESVVGLHNVSIILL